MTICRLSFICNWITKLFSPELQPAFPYQPPDGMGAYSWMPRDHSPLKILKPPNSIESRSFIRDWMAKYSSWSTEGQPLVLYRAEHLETVIVGRHLFLSLRLNSKPPFCSKRSVANEMVERITWEVLKRA
jgi:hypothetical protein